MVDKRCVRKKFLEQVWYDLEPILEIGGFVILMAICGGIVLGWLGLSILLSIRFFGPLEGPLGFMPMVIFVGGALLAGVAIWLWATYERARELCRMEEEIKANKKTEG